MSYIFKSIMTVLILAIVSACGHEKGGEIQTLVPLSIKMLTRQRKTKNHRQLKRRSLYPMGIK